MILEQIVETKRLRLKDDIKSISIEGWKEKLKRRGDHATLDFYSAVKQSENIAIIAEIKKASPSKGVIREDFNPVNIAKEYCASNVQALSVLTEEDFFLGSGNYLVNVRQSVTIPVLRKDFIIDLWQIYESRYLGADAILLIASILPDHLLKKFIIVAGILGMHCLVEVHTRQEVEKALRCGAKIIGINNRDLKTFNVDLRTTEKLISRIPHNIAVISESGIKTCEDISHLRKLGVDGVLIGEAFMKAPSISKKVEELKVKRVSCL